VLVLRSALALSFQSLFALGFLAGGDGTPWRSAADWWLVSFALAEMLNLWILKGLARSEGLRLRDLYNLGSEHRGADLKWLGIAILGAAPLGFIPNLLLAQALWGDSAAASDLLFRAVPIWAAWLMLGVFPVIHGLTELPTYFGYVMPRLQTLTGRSLVPLIATAAVLSVQHAFLPLLFDWRYIVWRALMFLPLAAWFAWVIKRRSTVLPYLAVAHALLDVSLPILLLQAALN
jgi:hypothetical protein